jgi:hypothetical protein
MSIIPRRGGETYAEQCIQEQKHKSKNGECENDINECVRRSRKCVNYDDSEKMTKCYRDAINWADKHCNSQPDHRHPDHMQPDHRQPDHRQPDHRQPDHRHPDHRQPDHRHHGHAQVRAERYGQECIEQDKSSSHGSLENAIKCVTHKCFNLDYDGDTIHKCSLYGVKYVQDNYDNSDFYGVY